MPSQSRYTFSYGGLKVPFEKEEIASIKFDGKSGVLLLGFKPLRKLKIWQNLTHSSFLFPDEGRMKGSTVAFAALLTKMIEKGVYGVAKFSPRINSTPRLVALLPQEEVFLPSSLSLSLTLSHSLTLKPTASTFFSSSLLFPYIHPQVIDESTGDVTTPNGLHVIPLPYADDCRDLQIADSVRADEDQVGML